MRVRRTWGDRRVAPEVRQLRILVAVALLFTAAVWIWPDYVPFTSLVLPLLLGSLLLGPRYLPWFVVFVLLLVVIAIAQQV